MPPLACLNVRAPVSAASAQPRSGSGVAAQIVGDQAQLGIASRLIGEAIEQFGKAIHASASLARLGFVFVAVSDDIERARLQAFRLAPMHQRIFLAMRDPDFGSAGGRDGCGQAHPNRHDRK